MLHPRGCIGLSGFRSPPCPALMPSPTDLGRAPVRRPGAHPPASPTLSWREQAEAGRYRDAVAEAERKGWDGILREASSADLLTLAEAARYAGRADRAEHALKTLRARFGRGDDAAVAAFLPGRITAETRSQRKSPSGTRPVGTISGRRGEDRLGRKRGEKQHRLRAHR